MRLGVVLLAILAGAADPLAVARTLTPAVLGATVVGTSAVLGGTVAIHDRRTRFRLRRVAADAVAKPGDSVDGLYLELIRNADRRGGIAFATSLVMGFLGAGTIIGGAAAGLLYGHADVGIFTAICGALPTAVSGLLGKVSSDANRESKEYFQQLADSRERDRHLDRALKVAKKIKDPDARADFLASQGLPPQGGGGAVRDAQSTMPELERGSGAAGRGALIDNGNGTLSEMSRGDSEAKKQPEPN